MFRYWDGQSWSEQTTSDPSAAAPGASAAPPPAAPTQMSPGQYGGGQDPYQQPGQQYGQQQPYDPYQQQAQQPYAQPGQYGGGGYGGQDPYGQGYSSGGSGGGGKRIAFIALAVLLIAALGVGGFFGVRALTDDDDDGKASDDSSQSDETDDTESPTDETGSPTDSPTEETPTDSPTDTGPTGRECTGGLPSGGQVTGSGQISGGDLTLPPVRGYQGMAVESSFTFADEVATVGKQIEEQWIALYAVGGLPKANGYSDLEASVDQVIDCMTESPNFYRNFTERNDLERESIDVNGHEAYSVTTEIRIDDPEVRVDGDVAKVIVVDTGDDELFGLYVSVVPIGNQNLIDQQEAATEQLQVDD